MHYLGIWLLTFAIAYAHQTNVNGSGKAIYWPNKSVPLVIRENSQTLSNSISSQIIRNSIAEWNQASTAKIVENSSASNEVTFQSDFSTYGPAVVGVTEISYASSGAIQKATILLNEQDFCFSGTPGFSSSCTRGSRIYLGDVVTHEMGHFFGLSHSEVLNSTMFYSNFPGQSSLAADDKAGIRNKYDTGYGKIYGYVQGGSHIGVLGAHIQAISLKTGEAIGAISAADGYFEIGGLNLQDSYYLYTSPLKKLDSLPSYFSNVQTSFCPSSYVGSFFSACGKENEGIPQRIPLSTDSPSVNVGVVTINCSLRANEDYGYEKLQSSFQSVSILNSAYETQTEKAFVGYFRSSEVNSSSFSSADKLNIDLRNFSALSGTQKYLKVSLVSQAFGNPIEYSFDLKKGGLTQINGPVFKSMNAVEGTYKVDILATIPLSSTAAQNNFDLEIKGKKLSSLDLAYTIPSAPIFASAQHFPYLVMVSIWEQSSSGLQLLQDTEVALSDNASCLDAPFTYAVSNAKVSDEKSSSSASDSSATAATIAGCGSVGPPDGGNGPSSTLLIMSVGFLLVALIRKSGKNFLS